jgi:hypothetical protein
VVDDDGDVFYKNIKEGTLEWVLPSLPFQPSRGEGEGEAREEGAEQIEGVDYVYGDEGTLFYLDGPRGPRLAPGWRRCEEGEDVWYTNEDSGDSSWEPMFADA